MPEVPIEQLRPTCDPASLPFRNDCGGANRYVGLIGQERAVEAIKFGLAMDRPGLQHRRLRRARNRPHDGDPRVPAGDVRDQSAAGRVVLRQQLRRPVPASRHAVPPGPGSAFARAMAVDDMPRLARLIPRTFCFGGLHQPPGPDRQFGAASAGGAFLRPGGARQGSRIPATGQPGGLLPDPAEGRGAGR